MYLYLTNHGINELNLELKYAIMFWSFVLALSHQSFLLTKYLFLSTAMAGAAPEGSQFDARQFDAKMNEL